MVKNNLAFRNSKFILKILLGKEKIEEHKITIYIPQGKQFPYGKYID